MTWADASDTTAWLPDTGSVTALDFAGADAQQHAADVRYNLATGTALLSSGLRAGDSYRLSAVLPGAATPLPATAKPGGSVTIDPATLNFLSSAVTKWTAGAGADPWTKLLAAARHLRDGAYSDGGAGQTQFLPGHSIGRLTSFLSAPQLVGDDEQYASVFALIANDLGLPARVVLGAQPEPDGTVRGRDVHAWVEVLLAAGGWVTVPGATFTPPTTRTPDKQVQQQVENSDLAVVPPPNSNRPPSSLDQLTQAGSDSSRRAAPDTQHSSGWRLPGFVRAALTYAVPPLVLVGLIALSIIMVKLLRRRRRRRAGPAATRVAAGWREILDQARDLGLAVGVGSTRREQALGLTVFTVAPLAERADAVLFGAAPADGAVSSEFWSDVLRARRDMALGVGRWRRWRALVSVRSLLARG